MDGSSTDENSWTEVGQMKVRRMSDEKLNNGDAMDDAVDAMAPQSACELCSDGGCDATATAL